MWNTVQGLLGSKKAMMAVLSTVASLVALFGYNLPVEVVAVIVGPLWLYIFSQGRADQGKEAAKVSAEAYKEEKANADKDPT